MKWQSLIKPDKPETQTDAPFRPETVVLVALGIVLVLAAGLFFELVEDLAEGDPLLWPDAWTYHTLQALRTEGFDRIMIVITELGDTPVVVTVTAVIALWLARERAWRTLMFCLLAVAGGSGINTAIKAVMQRARPGDMHYEGLSVFSFPSGHSTTNMVLYGFLAIILVRLAPAKWRVAIAASAAALAGAIGFSRLYLGAHWLSDVAGGFLFGTAWLALLSVFYFRHRVDAIRSKPLITVAAATLMVAGGVNVALSFDTDLKRYAVRSCCTPQDSPHPDLPDTPPR